MDCKRVCFQNVRSFSFGPNQTHIIVPTWCLSSKHKFLEKHIDFDIYFGQRQSFFINSPVQISNTGFWKATVSENTPFGIPRTYTYTYINQVNRKRERGGRAPRRPHQAEAEQARSTAQHASSHTKGTPKGVPRKGYVKWRLSDLKVIVGWSDGWNPF